MSPGRWWCVGGVPGGGWGRKKRPQFLPADLKCFQYNCSVAVICQQITILVNFNVANLRWLYSKFMQLITVIKLLRLQRKQSNPLLQLL